MICVWQMTDDCSVTSKSFLLQLDFFFCSTNETSIFITHGILVIVQYQRTSSEAAGCHYCSLCTFTCTFWNYHYFVEASSVYVITFVSKVQLASCQSYGYLVIWDIVLPIISCEMVPDEFFEFCLKLCVFNFSLSQVSVIACQKQFCTVSSHVEFHTQIRLICACCVCVFMLNKMTSQICELEPQCIPG